MLDTDATARETYFQTLPRTPLLTALEEAPLAAQRYDATRDAADRTVIRDTLLLAHLCLVARIAITYLRSPTLLDDRMQDGTLGLACAVPIRIPSSHTRTAVRTSSVWITVDREAYSAIDCVDAVNCIAWHPQMLRILPPVFGGSASSCATRCAPPSQARSATPW